MNSRSALGYTAPFTLVLPRPRKGRRCHCRDRRLVASSGVLIAAVAMTSRVGAASRVATAASVAAGAVLGTLLGQTVGTRLVPKCARAGPSSAVTETRPGPLPRKVAAVPKRRSDPPVELVEVDELRVGPLSPAAWCLIALPREDAYRSGDRDVLYTEKADLVLPVKASRRNAAVRQPVQGDVVQDVVPCDSAERLAVHDGARELSLAPGVVVEHPGRQAEG